MNQFKIMFMVLGLCLPMVYASAQPVDGGAGAPPAAPAPAPAPVPAGDGVAVPPVRGILGMEAGDYSFVQYDRGRLQSQYLNILEERSRADRDYFLRAVEQIEQSFVEFVQEAVYGAPETEEEVAEGEEPSYAGYGLKRLSDKAKGSGKFYPAETYLEGINVFQMGALRVRSRIRTLTSLADGALPSQIEATADGSGLDNVHNYGNINFGEIQSWYEERLNEIVTFVSNLQHNVTLANGTPHIIAEGSGGGLILAASSILLSEAKLREMREEMVALSHLAEEAEGKLDVYTDRIRILVQRWKTEYGKNETYRFRDAADEAARNDAFRQIIIAFWSRAYLRVAYGIPLGTIGIGYEKKWVNLDRFTVTTKALGTFHQERVTEQDDLMRVIEAYRNVLGIANERASKVLSGDTSLLTKANSFLTWVLGNRPTAECLEMVLTLMAADAYDEMILITEDDALRKLHARYEARYFANPDSEAQFRSLRVAYDPTPDERDAAEESDDPFGNASVVAGGSIRSEFASVLEEAQLQQTRLERARQLRLQIVAAEGANQFSKVNQRKKRL